MRKVSGGEVRKIKGREVSEILTKMFLPSDLLKLFLKRKCNITEFFTDTTVFFDDRNLHYEVTIFVNQSNIGFTVIVN